MGQEEILQILNKQPDKWFNISEIVEITGTNRNSVARAANSLAKTDFVDRKWDYQWNGWSLKPMLVFKYRKVVVDQPGGCGMWNGSIWDEQQI